jgi:hypothetical protein
MNNESPAQGRASADGLNVETKSTEGGGHGARSLTVKQRRRFPAVTVDGILARPPSTAQAHDLALSLGKVMRRDGTFESLRGPDDMLCVEIRPSHRDKVLELLGLSAWSWGEYVREWKAAGMAHGCSDLKRGAVRLFLEPLAVCPVPMCGGNVAHSNAERGSEQRSRLPTATETVLKAGDASGDEEGVGLLTQVNESQGKLEDSSSQEGSSEIAAFSALKRADIEIGDPMSDEEIRALGYRRTSRGWVPIHAA